MWRHWLAVSHAKMLSFSSDILSCKNESVETMTLLISCPGDVKVLTLAQAFIFWEHEDSVDPYCSEVPSRMDDKISSVIPVRFWMAWNQFFWLAGQPYWWLFEILVLEHYWWCQSHTITIRPDYILISLMLTRIGFLVDLNTYWSHWCNRDWLSDRPGYILIDLIVHWSHWWLSDQLASYDEGWPHMSKDDWWDVNCCPETLKFDQSAPYSSTCSQSFDAFKSLCILILKRHINEYLNFFFMLSLLV